jgi:hypothetical protein
LNRPNSDSLIAKSCSLIALATFPSAQAKTAALFRRTTISILAFIGIRAEKLLSQVPIVIMGLCAIEVKFHGGLGSGTIIIDSLLDMYHIHFDRRVIEMRNGLGGGAVGRVRVAHRRRIHTLAACHSWQKIMPPFAWTASTTRLQLWTCSKLKRPGTPGIPLLWKLSLYFTGKSLNIVKIDSIKV